MRTCKNPRRFGASQQTDIEVVEHGCNALPSAKLQEMAHHTTTVWGLMVRTRSGAGRRALCLSLQTGIGGKKAEVPSPAGSWPALPHWLHSHDRLTSSWKSRKINPRAKSSEAVASERLLIQRMPENSTLNTGPCAPFRAWAAFQTPELS
mmetsp:Transcript_45094/g.70685  ORF Transcript_45094/g.70685 Transcript_45094/m.70685 type:complete len:150 (+) Transcript_45094:548-997(+)